MEYNAIELLSQYIRIDTTNPPGNEAPAAKFFEEILKREGISFKTYESSPNRASIRGIIQGKGKHKPLLLMSHMDVVPADKTEWSFDPFGGEVIDGHICGRGTLDTKGLGIMQLMVFLELKEKAAQLNRDVIFLAVADEETGGSEGAGYLMENHFDDFDAGLVINEGGFGIEDMIPGTPVMMISSSEKGICWLRLKRKGIPGHGSAPHDQNPLERLILALDKLMKERGGIEIVPVVGDYFANMAKGWDFLSPYLENRDPEVLVKILLETGLHSIPQIGAMVKNTISVNKMSAGIKTNVIPGYAEAEIDVRLLPGQDVSETINRIKTILDDDQIEIEIITSCNASESPNDSDYYRLISDCMEKHYENTIVTPFLLSGTTDSRFFRERGIDSYGILPVLMKQESVSSIHGIDEKIKTSEFLKGIDVLRDIVSAICLD